jgi:hypothetical protein
VKRSSSVHDNGLVVDQRYADKAPFAFTGTVKKVVFDVAPHLEAQHEHALHEQASQAHTVRGISASTRMGHSPRARTSCASSGFVWRLPIPLRSAHWGDLAAASRR